MTENPKAKELSSNEWKVMKVLWEMGEGAARDISNVAEAKFNMSHATVKMTLHRLIGKDFLTVRAVGNSYLYQPSVPMEDALREAADTMLEETSEKAVETVMLHLVQKSQFTADGYKRLREMLDQQLKDQEEDDR